VVDSYVEDNSTYFYDIKDHNPAHTRRTTASRILTGHFADTSQTFQHEPSKWNSVCAEQSLKNFIV
jgi:hypothetical protein